MKNFAAALIMSAVVATSPAHSAEPIARGYITANGNEIPALIAGYLTGRGWMMTNQTELLGVFEKDGVRVIANYAGGSLVGYTVKFFAISIKDGKLVENAALAAFLNDALGATEAIAAN